METILSDKRVVSINSTNSLFTHRPEGRRNVLSRFFLLLTMNCFDHSEKLFLHQNSLQ